MLTADKKYKIDPNSIAIALTTFYPKWYRGKLRSIKHIDKIRGDLALEFIQKARKKGYHVVISDAKSSKSFRSELSGILGTKVYIRRAMKRSPGRRQAFKLASRIEGVQVIVSTEAEKISLLTDCMDSIVRPILNGETDIVVPARNFNLFKLTYPQYMFESEIEGNRMYNENLRLHGLLSSKDKDLDMFFGPRVIKNDRKILSFFMRKYTLKIGNFLLPAGFINPEQGSDTQFFPVVMALSKGFRIACVEVPFSYPTIQRENEEKGAVEYFREKRRNQRIGLLLELMHFINYIEKKKDSCIKSVKNK